MEAAVLVVNALHVDAERIGLKDVEG